MKDTLETIKATYQAEVISVLVDGIEQNPDTSDLHTLRRMSWLSLWLYVLGAKEDALHFADLVSHLDLKKYKKGINGFVDSPAIAHSFQYQALVLCSVICDEIGNSEKANEYWNQSLILRFETDKFGEPDDGQVARKRWKRNLEKGDLVDLYSKKRQSYIDNGKKAFYESFQLLDELLWMKQAGGSELYPIKTLTALINDIVEYLKANINDVDRNYMQHHIK